MIEESDGIVLINEPCTHQWDSSKGPCLWCSGELGRVTVIEIDEEGTPKGVGE